MSKKAEYTYTLSIEPERVVGLYSQLMEGLDQQLFDNMPPEATRKLLSQVLKRYRQIVGFDINADIDEILAVDTLMNQLAARGV